MCYAIGSHDPGSRALVVAIAAAILEIMFPFILASAVIAFICWIVRRLSGGRRSRYWRY